MTKKNNADAVKTIKGTFADKTVVFTPKMTLRALEKGGLAYAKKYAPEGEDDKVTSRFAPDSATMYIHLMRSNTEAYRSLAAAACLAGEQEWPDGRPRGKDKEGNPCDLSIDQFGVEEIILDLDTLETADIHDWCMARLKEMNPKGIEAAVQALKDKEDALNEAIRTGKVRPNEDGTGMEVAGDDEGAGGDEGETPEGN